MQKHDKAAWDKIMAAKNNPEPLTAKANSRPRF